MEELESFYDNLTIDELKEEIIKLATASDRSYSPQLTYAIGTYMLKLQEQSIHAPFFPLELAPIPKDSLGNWGKDYSEKVLMGQGGLKKHQVDTALIHTSFQKLTSNQWDKISSGYFENLNLYIEDLKSSGKSNYELPEEYKELVNTYVNEYKLAKSDLFKGLDKYQKKLSGCYIPLIILLIAVGVILWYFFF